MKAKFNTTRYIFDKQLQNIANCKDVPPKGTDEATWKRITQKGREPPVPAGKKFRHEIAAALTFGQIFKDKRYTPNPEKEAFQKIEKKASKGKTVKEQTEEILKDVYQYKTNHKEQTEAQKALTELNGKNAKIWREFNKTFKLFQAMFKPFPPIMNVIAFSDEASESMYAWERAYTDYQSGRGKDEKRNVNLPVAQVSQEENSNGNFAAKSRLAEGALNGNLMDGKNKKKINAPGNWKNKKGEVDNSQPNYSIVTGSQPGKRTKMT